MIESNKISDQEKIIKKDPLVEKQRSIRYMSKWIHVLETGLEIRIHLTKDIHKAKSLEILMHRKILCR